MNDEVIEQPHSINDEEFYREHIANELASPVADRAMLCELEICIAKALLRHKHFDESAERLTNAITYSHSDQEQKQIAEQIVLLVKAWEKQGDSADDLKKEELLSQAAKLAPTQALPVFAQYLQKRNRLPEAISKWQEAIRLAPLDANSYISLARLYEKAGQASLAFKTYLDMVEAVPSLRNYLISAERLNELVHSLPAPAPSRIIRIALLGNATLDHLQSFVTVECFKAGLWPTIYQAGFDQYTQEILNLESSLYAFAPNVLICAIHASRLFPQLHSNPFDMSSAERRAELDAGLKTVEHLLDTFTQHSPALVLLHNMVIPQYPALGLLDLRDDLGQVALFSEANIRLAEMARKHYKNVYIVDEDKIQARYGKAQATDQRLWLTARVGWSEGILRNVSKEYLRYLKAYKGLNRKCIVLDLDNTLWGGVIGEDGLSGIQLGSDAPGNAYIAFQRELEKLWRRGILLAVCSKNNAEDAQVVFDTHPDMILKSSHFAAMRINWESKAKNIREIATDLNIGLDSLVFLDDNPVERAIVRAELPQVLTPELPTDAAQYRNALLELDVFESLALTDEDRNRNKLYQEQKSRQAFESQFQSNDSLEQYLTALEMVVEIVPANNLNLPRIAQLTNKTNQFNLTTKRYSEAQISEMLTQGWLVYGMRVTDRFGDNGIVGVIIINTKSGDGIWDIDTFLQSCRVMGRGVETALLAFIAQQAQQAEIRVIQGWYLPTEKNSAAKDCYGKHNFRVAQQESDGRTLWKLDVVNTSPSIPAWLQLRTSIK